MIGASKRRTSPGCCCLLPGDSHTPITEVVARLRCQRDQLILLRHQEATAPPHAAADVHQRRRDGCAGSPCVLRSQTLSRRLAAALDELNGQETMGGFRCICIGSHADEKV